MNSLFKTLSVSSHHSNASLFYMVPSCIYKVLNSLWIFHFNAHIMFLSCLDMIPTFATH